MGSESDINISRKKRLRWMDGILMCITLTDEKKM